jgi:hypothetical protein
MIKLLIVFSACLSLNTPSIQPQAQFLEELHVASFTAVQSGAVKQITISRENDLKKKCTQVEQNDDETVARKE